MADWIKSSCLPNIDPYGKTYFLWLCIIFFSVMYNWVTIPLRMAYDQATSQYWVVSDYLCDTLYWMDIGINFVVSKCTTVLLIVVIAPNVEASIKYNIKSVSV